MRIRWSPPTILAAAVTVLVLAAVASWGAACALAPAYADTIGIVCP